MARTRRLWVPVLVGLLVAAVLGVGGGGAVAVEPRVTTRTITIPAGAFIPGDDNIDFVNAGSSLWTLSGSGWFTAPMFFEVPEVTIRRITLYAYDNSGGSGEDVCAELYRTTPVTGGADKMGEVCSSGASGTNPQALTTSNLTYRRITSGHGPSLRVRLPMPIMTVLYGVKITYSYDTGA